MKRPAQRTADSGFATPVAMAIALLMGLLAVTALQDAGLARTLATTRLLHQRAFSAGEIGLARATAMLAVPGAAAPGPARFNLPAHVTDGVDTTVLETAAIALPTGYSASRVIERHFEVRSTGWSARGARVVQVEGLYRHELALQP
ncbi:MAG: hypothetical protein ABI616_07255 [Pseudomonadota bacterium]